MCTSNAHQSKMIRTTCLFVAPLVFNLSAGLRALFIVSSIILSSIIVSSITVVVFAVLHISFQARFYHLFFQYKL